MKKLNNQICNYIIEENNEEIIIRNKRGNVIKHYIKNKKDSDIIEFYNICRKLKYEYISVGFCNMFFKSKLL